MKITYVPIDGEKREFIFRPGELTNLEAELIEIQGGEIWDSYEEFGRLFMNGNMRAYRAALWVCLRREQPRLKFNDLSFRVDQLNVELEEDERDRIVAAIADDIDIEEEQREALLSILAEGGQDQMVIKQLSQPIMEKAAESVGKDAESVSTTNST